MYCAHGNKQRINYVFSVLTEIYFRSEQVDVEFIILMVKEKMGMRQ